MHYEILDSKRLPFLEKLKNLNDRFFLAGGTGLALQIGHRISADFDFFCLSDFDTVGLFAELEKILAGMEIKKIQEEENTLSILADSVKLSFFKYPHALADDLVVGKNIKIASIADICLMKLATIVSRAAEKDYVDLYFIFNGGKIDLRNALAKMEKTIPFLDETLVLKSLVYFKDLKPEPINFVGGQGVDLKTVESFFKQKITEISLR